MDTERDKLMPAPEDRTGKEDVFSVNINAEFLKKALRLMAEVSELLAHGADMPGAEPGLEGDALNGRINAALALVGGLLKVSRVYVMQDENDGRLLRNTHEWVNADIGPAMASWPLHDYERDLPSLKPLLNSRPFLAGHSRDLPPDLERVLRLQAVDSVLVAPMLYKQTRIGLVGLDSCYREREWKEEEVTVLRHLALMVALALKQDDCRAAHGKLRRIHEILQEGEGPAVTPPIAEESPAGVETLQEAERRLITESLARSGGNRLRAAKQLGLTWAMLDRRCKKLGIEVKK